MKTKLAGFVTEVRFEKAEKAIDEADFLVADERLFNLFPKKLAGIKTKPHFLMKATELKKNLKTLESILASMHEAKLSRSGLVVGIGGGIITDITALAASLYMRGCRLFLIPTTILAMVDAAVGGKTAVNFRNYKNNIGNFYPAEKIIIDEEFLQKLPRNEFQNGFIEIKKVAILKDNGLYEMIANPEHNLKEMIKRAIEIKLKFCEDDLFDRNRRRFLNLGHTFAHVIETSSHFEIPHGLAVAKGIVLAAKYSESLGLLQKNKRKIIEKLFSEDSLPNFPDISFSNFKNIIFKDKKRDKFINLILLEDIFSPVIYNEKNIMNIFEFVIKNKK